MRKLLACALLFSSIIAVAQKSGCYKASMLVKVVEKYHIQPRQLNDSLSSVIFDNVLSLLDPQEKIFTEKDVQALEPFRYSIQAELVTGKCGFLQALTKIYRNNLLFVDSITNEILSKPFDFTQKDSITFTNARNVYYAKDFSALKKRWLKHYKYRALLISTQPDSGTTKPLTESAIRAKLKATAHRKNLLLINPEYGLESTVEARYLNAIATAYDPHTNYFTPEEYKSFQNATSAKTETYGIVVDESEQGEIVVERLLPGSSAWKTNQLHKGDVILRLQAPGKEALEVALSDIDEVDDILNEVATASILVTVRTANGNEQTVTLYRQAIKLEENLIKSYIFEGPEKIGYISLPDFYTDWNSYNALGCANDVAKEIIKLKKENIQGLILDLRYNGGGSMQEAAGLAGIFINEGPLCIMDETDKPKVLKDPNRGTAYDRPLLVMVNTLSASASEFTAAVLQDYNRALIVGSPTYGKASMQIVMPVDTSAPTAQTWTTQRAELGYLKITEGGFYRVTGKSHQRTGIQPDVHLPDSYEKMHIREEDEPQALYFDTVNKKTTFSRLPNLPIAQLAEKSANRIKANTTFKELVAISDSIYNFRTDVPMALTPASVTAFKKQTNSLYEEYDRLTTTPVATFKVNTHSYQTDLMKEDEYSRELNKRIADDLVSDIYIDEAYRILSDLIKIGNH